MSAHLAQLRSAVELALAGRVVSPFTFYDRNAGEHVPTGISEIDALAGGLPRGALTEISGSACSGRTSLLFSALGNRTAEAEACALIDGCDAFDPHSAAVAGVDLQRLLWVRCRNLEQSFRAADLLLQAGGFGFIALDLSDVPCEWVQRVPLDTWFRLRRAVEDTPTILVVLEQEAHAKTCASLVLRFQAEKACWSATRGTSAHSSADQRSPHAAAARDASTRQASERDASGRGASRRDVSGRDPAFYRYPFSRLLDGAGIHAELLRSRMRRILHPGFEQRDPGRTSHTAVALETNWNYLRFGRDDQAEQGDPSLPGRLPATPRPAAKIHQLRQMEVPALVEVRALERKV